MIFYFEKQETFYQDHDFCFQKFRNSYENIHHRFRLKNRKRFIMDFGENVSYKKDKVYLIFEISLIFSLYKQLYQLVFSICQFLGFTESSLLRIVRFSDFEPPQGPFIPLDCYFCFFGAHLQICENQLYPIIFSKVIVATSSQLLPIFRNSIVHTTFSKAIVPIGSQHLPICGPYRVIIVEIQWIF